MAHKVCPWWVGYFLASPLRRLAYDPAKILAPYVREGMTVLEPGPGMGFFTLELARMVGPSGRVIAVDVQPRMLDRLKRRVTDAGLAERVDIRLVKGDSLGTGDLAGSADFVLAFAMVHEVPSPESFFNEAARALKPGACMLLAEPLGHVSPASFADELTLATQAGFTVTEAPMIRRSQTAVLRKA
ncbi:MAG TPA: class I SAM-dependent methyltransferase [Bryobacteraceae bacterium]|nr:class I SAM-dependent methyltransferase [Bryobacteraceae bacterium]